jgi:hypothetical protein
MRIVGMSLCSGVLTVSDLIESRNPNLRPVGGIPSMDEKIIPDTIAQFILERIESVAELEGLLILKEDPRKSWTARALAEQLYLTEIQTDELLRTLCLKALVSSDTGSPLRYVYRPGSSELAASVDELANFYPKHIVPVTNLIHSRSKRKVQGFADAFRFRKDS